MPINYLVYEDAYQSVPWTCSDFKTASSLANDFEKQGKHPQIYQLVYAYGEMQNGKK